MQILSLFWSLKANILIIKAKNFNYRLAHINTPTAKALSAFCAINPAAAMFGECHKVITDAVLSS